MRNVAPWNVRGRCRRRLRKFLGLSTNLFETYATVPRRTQLLHRMHYRAMAAQRILLVRFDRDVRSIAHGPFGVQGKQEWPSDRRVKTNRGESGVWRT